MWTGDIPQDLRRLTLAEQKVIALYRHSSCIIKLFSITSDPSLAQTALKGNVLTFPQSISDIVRTLPLSSNTLPDLIKIIFVGRTCPKKEQVRSTLTVRREVIQKALIWLHNNILYKDIYIDHLLIEALPINDIPDCFWNTVSAVDESENSNIERSGYVNNDVDSDKGILEDIIALNTSALIDTNGSSISSNDITQHLLGRMNITDQTAVMNVNIYLIPQGRHPENEYFQSLMKHYVLTTVLH